MIKEQPAASRSDYGRKNSSQEASVHNTARSSTAISSHTAPNRYRSQSASNARQEDENSASETLQMHQEEQDLVNMMASSRVHSLDGHYQMPIKFASSHMPVPFSMLSPIQMTRTFFIRDKTNSVEIKLRQSREKNRGTGASRRLEERLDAA
ncbi:hypothetical protein POM88_018412 [Heracleum sosnowskyi]|uniref:Uncharacterized protein n=1 Tax=Heracleum sosnowskyi TaxID=360622 RepID=A0AAD8IQG8_9APIA|nr:hypothetical protein POM88_018412 [Heracleum sosnowskyi]